MKLDHLVLLASNLADSTRHYGIILPVLGFEKSRDGVWINSDGIAIDLRAAEDAQAYKRYAPGLNHFPFQLARKWNSNRSCRTCLRPE